MNPTAATPSTAADSVLAEEYDDALSEAAFIAHDLNGDPWRIQPTNLQRTTSSLLFTSHTLIVMEQSDGPYEPVGIASSEVEALDMISQDYHRRKPENDDLCPEGYALWTRNDRGHYQRTAEISRACTSHDAPLEDEGQRDFPDALR